ncbi:MAG: hypothetical protein P4L10_14735 [Acidobacteriaceae bacterium]|nr:hypothetical protein [Acidobacteriaceae bacterium]
MQKVFEMLSANEAIRRYMEYYDKLMEDLNGRRVFRFDRGKALRARNLGAIEMVKAGLDPVKEKDEHPLAEISGRAKEETKKENVALRETRTEQKEEKKKESPSKLWDIIRKQEMKVRARSAYVKNGTSTPVPGQIQP